MDHWGSAPIDSRVPVSVYKGLVTFHLTCCAMSKLKCISISLLTGGKQEPIGGTSRWPSTVKVLFNTSLDDSDSMALLKYDFPGWPVEGVPRHP